jgi:type IV pilus assembly protein PilN
MKVLLNLATNPQHTHRKFFAASALLGAIAAILFVALGWHVYSVRKSEAAILAREAATREEMAGLVRQRQELAQFFARPENAQLAERSAFLNTLIDQQSLNWTQLFMDLEKVLPVGVRLLSIEPRHEKGSVLIRFSVGATSDEAKLKFIRALENSPAFAHVEEFSEQKAEEGLRIEMSAAYTKT